MAQCKKAISYLALFSEEQIRHIATEINTRGVGAVVSEVRAARDNYAPPAIFGKADPSGRMDAEKVCNAVLGMATQMFYGLAESNTDTANFETILTRLFGISSNYAQKLADGIDTQDEPGGIVNTMRYYLGNAWNALADDTPLEASVNSVDDDVDKMYELSKFGEVIKELNSRAAFGLQALNSIMKTEQSLQQAFKGLEGGDIAIGDAAAEILAGAPSSFLEDEETGGIFRKLGRRKKRGFGKRLVSVLRKVASSPLGQVALSAIPGAGGVAKALDIAGSLTGDEPQMDMEEINAVKRRRGRRRKRRSPVQDTSFKGAGNKPFTKKQFMQKFDSQSFLDQMFGDIAVGGIDDAIYNGGSQDDIIH